MLVDDDGTGLRMFDVEGFLRNERLWKADLLRKLAPLPNSRDCGGLASPKMKNLMNAPRRRTTDSWPSKRPCVKDSLSLVSSVCSVELKEKLPPAGNEERTKVERVVYMIYHLNDWEKTN